jgi:hypothetical protein
MAGATHSPRDKTMTRKSRIFCQVEALEPKVLLSAARAATQLPKGPATVAVEPLISPGASTPTTTQSSATAVPATTVDPTAALENALDGSYVHVRRSLSVMAEGSVTSLGQVNVNGSITVSGPKSAQNVTGMLLLIGSEGSVTIQLQANKARRVIGNENGPVTVTETVIGATGNGISVQGESGSGFLALGRWVGTKHGKMGETAAPHGSFWLVVRLNPPTG